MNTRGRVRSPEMSYPADFYRDSTAIRLVPPKETGRRLLSHPKVLQSRPGKYSQRDCPLRLT
jgi:hypothetical protein